MNLCSKEEQLLSLCFFPQRKWFGFRECSVFPTSLLESESSPHIGFWNKLQHPILSCHEFSLSHNSGNWKNFLSWSCFVISVFAPTCNPFESPSALTQCAHILGIVQKPHEIHIPGRIPWPLHKWTFIGSSLPGNSHNTSLGFCSVA